MTKMVTKKKKNQPYAVRDLHVLIIIREYIL